jgi:hypothetical protein
MWKIDSKDKHTNKNMIKLIGRTFVIAELPYGTWGKRKKKRE